MKKLNKNELISLRSALIDVEDFIRKVKRTKPYYCLQFDNMINNIEIYLYSGDTDLYLISQILFRDWKNANNELLGIPGSDWLQGNASGQPEDIFHLWELIAVVDTYFVEADEEKIRF